MEVEKEGYAEGAVFLLSLEGVQDWTQVKQRNISSLYVYCIRAIYFQEKKECMSFKNWYDLG